VSSRTALNKPGAGGDILAIRLSQRSKYGAEKAVIDGYTFDSRREAYRYQELKLMVYAGEISRLELQKEFVLQESFRKNGKAYRAIIYKADFVYELGGKTIVEDAKGCRTKDYQIKKKLFEKRYPDLTIREV
jgi:hypothetical protein